MQLVVAKKDLLRLVGRCQGVADKKSAMPALSNILLTAEGGVLHVSATDTFLSITGTIPAEIESAGSAAVPARELFDRVKAMPEGPVHLSTSGTGQTTIKAAGAPRRFTMLGIPAADFPPLPKPDGKVAAVSLPVDAFAKLMARTFFSIAQDETRAHVNSAKFEWTGNRARMVTTDGHRLSKMEITIDGTDAAIDMLIPAKAIQELRRLCDDARADRGDAKDPVMVTITRVGPTAFFEIATMRFGVKLVDAQFPAYNQVVPSSTGRAVRTPRKGFSEALDAVRIAASDRTGGVKITTLTGLLRVTSESPESGNGFDEVPVDFSGPELTIGFNAKYFLDVLNALDDEEVVLGLSGELDPAVIRPAVDSEKESFVGVIMPMRI
jgi:DNA polymerase-3 subunit beta